jgi:signal transduction histidine kinase
VHPAIFIVCGELLAQSSLAVLSLTLPLPTAHYLPRPLYMKLDDARIDLLYTTVLFLPLLVFLIYYGYLEHGLVGATAWSLATMGPHYLIRLLNDRRASLIERTEMLRLMNADLENSQRALREFVYTVTHDLKSPINSMLLTADLLLMREGTALSSQAEEELRRIVQLAGNTEDMIRDLLGVFHIVSSQEQPTEVDLHDLVMRAVDNLRPQIVAKRIEVVVGPLSMVWGQPAKLGHVVANLLSNAVKYVPSGHGRVEITTEQLDGCTRLTVSDNGIGIPSPYHRAIFELFLRVPAAEQTVDGKVAAGTGVGLAIVKRIIAAHGGTTWVVSEPGNGSRFYVDLPAPPS